MKCKLKKGDTVQIISGKGAVSSKPVKGKVLRVFPQKGKVLVEGYNFIKRHTKPSQQNQQGGIIEKEAPISISNVMLVSPKSGKITRVGSKTLKDGSKVRFSHKLQEEIDWYGKVKRNL